MRPSFSARAAVLVALTLVACSACTATHVSANPPTATVPAPATSADPASASPTGGSRVAAQVDVDRPDGGQPAVITVTLPPVGSVGTGCGDATTAWIPFSVDFADHGRAPTKQDNEHTNLAARVEIRGGGGDVGVALDSNGETGCPGSSTLPASDSFSTMVISGGYHVRTNGFVVVRGSRAPAGLTLAVTGLRKAPDDIWPPASWAWQVQRFETGGACPGDPASVCVPLAG